LFLFFFSCGEVVPSLDQDEAPRQTSIYVCHNPNSELHNEVCSPGCFEPSASGTPFCWLLQEKDCYTPNELEWQKEVCPLFD